MDKRPSKITIDDDNNSSSIFLPVFAIVALGLFLTLCWYAYTYYIDQQKKEGVYYIKADKSPLKVKPDNPGGLVVENQDKQIFNAMVGDAENLDGKINTVEGEAPASSEDIAKAVQAGFAENAVPSDLKDTDVKIELPNDISKSEIPKDVVAAEKPVEQPKETVKSEVEKTVAAESEKKEELKEAVVTKAKPDEKAIMVTKEKDAATGKDKTIVTLKEDVKPSIPAPKSMGGKAVVVSAPASGGKGFFVQISSHRTTADLEGGWKRFSSKYSAVSAGASKNITEATVNGVKFYRLSFGPYASRQSAIDKCKALKVKGQDCLVQAY